MTNKIELGVIVAAVVALVFLWLAYRAESHEAATLRGTVIDLRTELGSARADIEKLKTSVKTCGESVTYWKKEADDRKKEAQAKLDEAAKKRPEVVKWVTRYITEPRPAGLNACENAERLLNDEIAAAGSVR